MQDLLDIENLEMRRAVLRQPVGDLCRLAGMNPSTWERARKGADVGVRRIVRAAEALVAEEHRLLEHLISLHPERARALLADGGGSRGEAGGAGGGTHAARSAGEISSGEGQAA